MEKAYGWVAAAFTFGHATGFLPVGSFTGFLRLHWGVYGSSPGACKTDKTVLTECPIESRGRQNPLIHMAFSEVAGPPAGPETPLHTTGTRYPFFRVSRGVLAIWRK